MQEAIVEFLKSTGYAAVTWGELVMIAISAILMYLAIVRKFEPLLLLPISFGML
ncbi:MAG: sodium ion-translocating decarboxylase subunit beta, partial [Bacillota bacterium]